MAVQINVRFDDELVEALDALASEEGRSRPEVVREAVVHWLAQSRRAKEDEAYRRAYEEHPETPEELEEAEQNAARLVAEEPWERWW